MPVVADEPAGPLRFLFNNPQMHIWHYAKHMPHRYGANYGISLSVWDYLFGTAYMPVAAAIIHSGG